MNKINYFPLGIAKGVAFCNRVTERRQLKDNITKNKHTLVISPRRYGKSSLVLYTLEESRLTYQRTDLFVAINAKTIEDQILNGIKALMKKISSTPEQAVIIIKNFIKTLKSKWIVGTDGFNIELIPEQNADSATVIMESLEILEDLLVKKKQHAVFFIDEFQEIGNLANSSGIEGAIRHVAQESKNLCFIFSGSNRHILANMFDDRSRPLYMLCDRMSVDKIHEKDYVTFVNKISNKIRGESFDSDILTEVFRLTELHPYYINVLCDKLFSYSEDTSPSITAVSYLWEEYVLQEESKTAKELGNLNLSQKKLMIAIAHGKSHDLMGKEVLGELNLTSAAVAKSLKFLEEQDYLTRHKNGNYFVLDPLLKASLILFYPQRY